MHANMNKRIYIAKNYYIDKTNIATIHNIEQY